MKKILTVLALALTALISTIALAEPYFDRTSDNGFLRARQEPSYNRDGREQLHSEQRRMREERRGVQRLKQHLWQTGYVMPQHYRGNGYKIEYQNHNLPKPDRNQQWYKINNDYILIDSDTNDIIQIVRF